MAAQVAGGAARGPWVPDIGADEISFLIETQWLAEAEGRARSPSIQNISGPPQGPVNLDLAG